MADLDDLRIVRPAEPEPPLAPPPRLPFWLPILVAVAAGAMFALWYFGTRREALPVNTPAASKPTSVAPERLQAEPGEALDLPPLDESDAIVRSLIGRLSSHPQVAAWLTTDHLIRNMTAVVTNVAEGQTPAPHLAALRPTGKFAVRQSGGQYWIDPGSYQRYDHIADAVETLDARGVARFYATVKPRIDEAHRDLGTPGDFDDTLKQAIVMLLRTPIVDRDVRLHADSVSYTFEDPALEQLSDSQKQFLRMGPRNMRIVKAKLRDVAHHLGIPDSALPLPDTR